MYILIKTGKICVLIINTVFGVATQGENWIIMNSKLEACYTTFPTDYSSAALTLKLFTFPISRKEFFEKAQKVPCSAPPFNLINISYRKRREKLFQEFVKVIEVVSIERSKVRWCLKLKFLTTVWNPYETSRFRTPRLKIPRFKT